IFADLALELRPVTLTGGTFTIGGAIGQVGLSSNATLDNVESLYFTGAAGGGTNLPAGAYALIVTGDTALATTIGLSYRIVPVPEPCGLLLVGAGGLVLLRRRWA